MNLTSDIRFVKGVGEMRAKRLNRLNIFCVYDLLMHIPRGYDDQRTLTPITALKLNEKATVMGRVEHIAERQTRTGYDALTAIIDDGHGTMQLTWFGRSYVKKILKVGARIFATGKIGFAYGGMGQLNMNVASFEVLDKDAPPPCALLPIYGTTDKLRQEDIRRFVKEALTALNESDAIPEILPSAIVARYSLFERRQAFFAVHFPQSIDEAEKARERLAFEELFLIQCGLIHIKKKNTLAVKCVRHMPTGATVRKIFAALPFALTEAQKRVWHDVCLDMENRTPMRRLLQGDVGSGKTVIAALALAKTVENGFQGALMVPTEILATQHLATLTELFSQTDIRVGFLSGRLSKKEHEKMHELIKSGGIDVVVGTHALIQKDVVFANLGLAVTDEQHRFGVTQRATLGAATGDNIVPDMLVMTATPIPRSLTLTLYGDLNVSIIDELPAGRKKIRTFVRTRERRQLIYEYVRHKLDEGQQAYVVCPRVEQDETGAIPSVEEIGEELGNGIMSGKNVGILHGKMKSAEKDKIMQAFAAGEIQLLVATTVIEVGINVPNACLMVVEFAERFGLSQLHQLRGRVGRSSKQSYCILIAGDVKNADAKERLKIMEQTNDGFLLAQKDLELRGPGQFFGKEQSGLNNDLKVASVLKDINILLKARKAAESAANNAEELKNAVANLALLYGKDFMKMQDA